MPALTPLAATGIGSVPFTDPEETVALILETLPQIPYWPQMVRLGFSGGDERPGGPGAAGPAGGRGGPHRRPGPGDAPGRGPGPVL